MTTTPRQPTPEQSGDAVPEESTPPSVTDLDAAEAGATPDERPESRQVRRYREQMAARAARRGPHKA